MPIPKDTTLEAARIQYAIWKKMGMEERLKLAFQMSEDMRRVLADGVRHRHPDYTVEQVELAVKRLLLGDKLFREAFPGKDIAT